VTGRGALPPEALAARHDLGRLANGRHASLDTWLRDYARTSEGLSSRTYVICAADEPDRVVGYYAIATAVAQGAGLPSAKLRRAMPDEVPLLLIGRLAVDQDWQSGGYGVALLADALRRCLAAGEIVGARGVIAHAIDETALSFYLKQGFVPAPELGNRVVLAPIDALRTSIAR
jgi:GNAT superfamily N-acetyltransferase